MRIPNQKNLRFQHCLWTIRILTKRRKPDNPKKVKKTEEPSVYKCTHCAHQTLDWFHRTPAMFACSVEKCFKFYISKNGLKGHCIRAHKDVLSCNKCDYIATSKNFLLDHKKSHDLKKFKCPFCTKGFGSVYDQNCHQVKCVQNPNRAITCKKCINKGTPVDVTGAEQGLVLRLQQEHSLKGDWLCIYCHKLYVSEKRFDSHFEKCKKACGKALQSSTEETTDETDLET